MILAISSEPVDDACYPMVEEADTGRFLGLNGWSAYPTGQTVVNEKLCFKEQSRWLLRNTAHKADLWSQHACTQIPAPNILSGGKIYFDSASGKTVHHCRQGMATWYTGRGSLWLPILGSVGRENSG